MATITTDTFLDAATGTRTAGETWAINGATLTIRTDTRYYLGAPTGRNGSLGTLTVSSGLGGGIKIDGTKVRWLPFTGGSGTVPALHSQVTQGGVSGTILGVWSALNAIPALGGEAMPTTGFIKFREVTGGTFAAGALTGITATASGPDVTGWIEIVMDAGAALAGHELGTGVVITGDWFYLDNTSGARGQVIQIPTGGGGAATQGIALQIETAPGSGVYEWWPTVNNTNFIPSNIATDVRSKLLYAPNSADGKVIIGYNTTTLENVGYLPPAGCRVRIPNVIGRTVLTTARSTNQTPGAGTRATITGGRYDINCLHSEWNWAGSNQIVSASVKNSCFDGPCNFRVNKDPLVIDGLCVGGWLQTAATQLTLDTITNGTVANVKLLSTGFISGTLALATISGVSFENIEVISCKARASTIYAISNSSSSRNCTFTNVKVKGAGSINLVAAQNITFKNIDYIDRLEGPTTTNSATQTIQFAGSSNITIDGLTLGEGGQLANTQPYNYLFGGASSPNSNIKIRNIGTRAAPLNTGSANLPQYIYNFATGDNNIKIQRVFVTGTRTGISGAPAVATLGIHYEDVYTGYGAGMFERGRYAIYRKIGTALPSVSLGAESGTHWVDHFTSDTTGAIRWHAEPPITETSATNYLNVAPNLGTGYIGLQAYLSLDAIGDEAISESEWQFLGHTGFQNAAPTLTGTVSGLTVYYQLDTGGGYSGTWKLATGANLSGEAVSPAGFKMKIRILQTQASTATTLQAITFLTTSTVQAQAENQYPLDTVNLGFTNLVPGTEVRAYVGTDPATAVLIGGTESTGGSTFSFSHSNAGQAGFIHIFAMGYQPIYIPYTYEDEDTSLLIQQVIDRNYVNP